ncbi:MAG: galactokinase [Armatimonadota bacterium]
MTFETRTAIGALGYDEPMVLDVTQRAKQLFVRTFATQPAFAGSAPGRVELLGNHTDYNGGFVLTAAVDIRTAVVIRRSSGAVTRICTELPGCSVAHVILRDGPGSLRDQDRWCGYVAGILDFFSPSDFHWDVAVASDVPDGSGISSSAAVLVATASAVLTALERAMSAMEIAVACRAVENGSWVGAPVGLLDQFSSACGERGMALFLDCKSFDWKRVPLDDNRLGILIVNTNVKHALADGGGYATRRRECEAAAMALTQGSSTVLRDVSTEAFNAGINAVEQPSQSRARHIFGENERVILGTKLLEQDDFAAFGAQLNASHLSCRTLFENTCPEIDRVQEILERTSGVYGAKLSGGGWGGSVVAVINPKRVDGIIVNVTREYGDGLSFVSTYAATGAVGEQL